MCQSNIYLQGNIFTFSTKLLVPVCMCEKGAGGRKGMRDRKGGEESRREREGGERLRSFDSFIDLFSISQFGLCSPLQDERPNDIIIVISFNLCSLETWLFPRNKQVNCIFRNAFLEAQDRLCDYVHGSRFPGKQLFLSLKENYRNRVKSHYFYICL